MFSSPDPPFLSFCRIDSRDARHKVVNHGKILSYVVQRDDVIVFGKYEPSERGGKTQRVWVDTVLVVADLVRWTSSTRMAPCGPHCKKRKWTLKSPADFAARVAGTAPGTPNHAYEFNLSDAEPQGWHCCTNLADYRVVVGRAEPIRDAVAALQTSFVPLADGNAASGWRPVEVSENDLDGSDWRALCSFLDDVVRVGVRVPPRFMNQGAIAEFPTFELAAALCEAVVRRSGHTQGRPGVVAIPPLIPLHVTRFLREAEA